MANERFRFDRRSILLGAAGGAGAYFLPSLAGQRAHAAAPPRRLLVFMTQHGNPYFDWSMRKPGLSENAEWEFNLGGLSFSEFSETYRPLHPFRNKLLVMDTLSNPVCLEMKGAGGGHFGGPASLLTGSTITNDKQNKAQGASVDQTIAQKVFVAGGVRSIEMGVNNPYPAIWAQGGSALPIRSAGQVFTDVFANRNLGPPKPPSNDAPSAPQPPSRADRILAARKRILDHTQKRYRDLAGKISAGEKSRLETHADLLGDLAASLAERNPSDPSGGGGLPPAVSAGCAAPSKPAGGGLDAEVKSMAALAAAAFACDITRVASIQLGQMRTADFGGPGGADVHQDVAHHGDRGSTSYNNMVKYYRKHAEHLASILSALDSIEEPDGSRVLDNTIVLWGQECGSWIHQTSHLPIVVAGGGGFKMGRYLHWGNIDPVTRDAGNGGDRYRNIGPPISRLLVSIARQMGVQTNQIGNASTMRGANLTGPLDRLL